MGLGSVSGVFSREFVVGFFLPAYVAVVALWLTASRALIPDSLERYTEAAQLAILGGIALIAALALSGMSDYVVRAVAGYPLRRAAGLPLIGLTYRLLVWIQRRRYNRLLKARANTQDAYKRGIAAWELDCSFPHDDNLLLPTRVGNAFRAFEQHANTRWGLDGVTVWPRIEALMSAGERELIAEARTNFFVFINGSLGAFTVGIALAVDKAVHAPEPALHWPLYALPFVVGYSAYRLSLAPTLVWGEHVRAAVDLHRLELYEKLGVRAPTSFSDERDVVARQVNKALIYGRPRLSDELWRHAGAERDRPEILTRWSRKGG
jgi:hypothetical protein